MADMSAEEVITAAYRKNRILTPTSQQLIDGLQDLQNMLSSWSADGLAVPSFSTDELTLVSGQSVYTIGSGGDFDTVRPLWLISAFIRISNIDYPVHNMAKKIYNRITAKDTEAQPSRMYYDPQYPLGKIKFNYEADSAYAFHLISMKPLSEPSTLATAFSVPNEANLAMIFNLAVILSADNNVKLLPQVFSIADSSLSILETINALEHLSDTVDLDSGVSGVTHGRMNILSGDVY